MLQKTDELSKKISDLEAQVKEREAEIKRLKDEIVDLIVIRSVAQMKSLLKQKDDTSSEIEPANEKLDNSTKLLTIKLTGEEQITILADEWKVIASTFEFDDCWTVTPPYEWRIKVLEHADGRWLVYGTYDSPVWKLKFKPCAKQAGYIVNCLEDLRKAIFNAATEIGNVGLSNKCIEILRLKDMKKLNKFY
jgi:chromosome segregation ATPase